MSSNDIFSTIVESLNLSAEGDLLKTHLDRWLSSGGKVSATDPLMPVYQKIIESAKELNEAEILQRLTEFRRYLQTLPSLELTIAFEPDEAFKQQVSKELTTPVNRNLMVKFIINKEIIAGCLINFNGKFADYSLLKTLEDNRESIFGEILGEMRD